VKITTLDGKKVNVLVHDNEYYFIYNVSYTKKHKNLRVGMLIRDLKGNSIGGGSKEIDYNKYIYVKWKFTCRFNEGTYYINAGTSSDNQHLHRILDAYSFKVMPIKEKIFTGVVNNIVSCEVLNG